MDARVRRTALALGLFLTPLVGWAAYNQIPPGVLVQSNLGAGVFAALGHAPDATGGFVIYDNIVADITALGGGIPLSDISGWGTGVATALGNALDTAGGLVSYSSLATDWAAVITSTQVHTALSMSASVALAIPNAVNGANGLLQLNASSTVPQANLTTRASAASVVAAPVAPASTSVFAMQGLAGTITPATTGRIKITISGTIVAPTSTVVDNGISYQISTGTGTAPVNAASLTGTQVGPVQTYTSAVAPTAAADVHVPFSVSYLVTGLTLGTPVWIDLAAKSVTTASAMGLSNVGVIAIEF